MSATRLRTLPCVTTSSMEPLPTTAGGAEAAPEAAAAAAGPAAVGDALASASAGLLAGFWGVRGRLEPGFAWAG